MQKHLIFLLVIIAGPVNAALGPNLLSNGNFEAGAAGWSRWWGGNSGLPVTDPIEGDRAAGVWWNDDGIFQNIGSLGAGTYEFGGKLLTPGGLTNQRAVIEAKMDNGTSTWTQQLEIVPGNAANVWHSRAGIITLSAPASVTITLMLADNPPLNPGGIAYFDDIYCKHVIPQEGRIYYGAKLEPQNRVMHTAGQTVSDFNAYWNLMDAGEKPACYMTYCNLTNPFVPVLREDLERYRHDYGIYMPVQLGLYIVGIEDDIAAGLWDADIARFCNELNQLGYPLYIRIGYECNGSHNNYDPTNYKAAFIRITNALRANHVEAATVFNVIQGPYTAWYPGDAYVDWMSINAFSIWNIQHPDTATFLNDAHARGKPVLIGEADPTWWHTDQGQASWDGYFVPYFNLIETFGGIKNFCYINTDWTSSSLPDWGDCRLQPYPIVAQHYRDEMDSSLYLHGTDEAALRAEITGITDTVAPNPVTGIAVDSKNTPVTLSWNAAADNTGINRYEILRDGVLAGYNTTESFKDTDVAAGKTYIYQITAIDKGGNRSPASNPVMVVTTPSIQKVLNGEYDTGRGPWSVSYNAAGVAMTTSIDTSSKLSGLNSCKLNISQATGTNWHLQYSQNLNTTAGFAYQLTYKAVADRSTSMTVALQETHSPYSSFIVHTAALTTSPQTFTVTGIAPDNDNVNLTFMLGSSAPRTIWIDAIRIMETSPNPDPQTCGDVYNAGVELIADLSGDCSIDIEDLILFADDWLNTACNAGNEECGGADLGLNGSVTMADLSVLSLEWLRCNDPQDSVCQPTW